MNEYKMANNSLYGSSEQGARSPSLYGITDYYEWYIKYTEWKRLKKVRDRKEKLKRIWKQNE